LLGPLAAQSPIAVAERWARRLRLGREYAEVFAALCTKARAASRALRDRRGMRDSRLYALLAPLPPEALVYLHATGDKTARDRVLHFARVVARIRPAVSGNDLVALGAEPSAAFSAILSRARADRLDGKAVGREGELANLRRLAVKAGLLDR
jgi:hypothetical protein